MLKTNETGRSMVEMLGVLAVMGVLSVSGVAMYTTAMNKHRANELLNAVSMRATALASQRMTGKALSLSGFTDNTQGTSVINVNSENTDAIEITITNVPVGVCKNLYSTKGANVVEMKSGTTVLNNASACVEGATVSIKFNNDLSKVGSSGGTGGNSGSGSGQQQTDPCAGFIATTCTTTCTNNNGTAQYTYAAEGTSCASDNKSACDGAGTCNQCPSKSYAKEGCIPLGEATNVSGCYCTSPRHFYDGSCELSG